MLAVALASYVCCAPETIVSIDHTSSSSSKENNRLKKKLPVRFNRSAQFVNESLLVEYDEEAFDKLELDVSTGIPQVDSTQ